MSWQQYRRTWVVLLGYLVAVLAVAFLFVGNAHAQDDTGDLGTPEHPLRVATKPLEPFVFLGETGPSGFSIDLWDEVANRLSLSYEWVEFETVSEILSAVENGDADAAIAGISMTREREGLLDFSHPYFDAGLQIMTRSSSGFSLGHLFELIFSPGLLAFLALAVAAAVIMSHVILLVERRDNPEFPPGYFAGLWEGIWYLMGMVATGEHPDKSTSSAIKRLMVISFWLIGLLLVAQFTATVTSTLTVKSLNSSIKGPEDLPGKAIATVRGSTSATYLSEHGIPFTGVEQIEDAFSLLLDNSVDAIVYDAPVLRYYSVTGGRGQVEIVGTIFRPEKYGIALYSGSLLREPINEVLLEMYQDGTLEVIYDRWFGS